MVGVSTDAHETQREFAASLGVSFPMVGDADGSIARQYGVLWPLLGRARRVTFVIDREGIIRAVFHHEVAIGKHLEGVRRALGAEPRAP